DTQVDLGDRVTAGRVRLHRQVLQLRLEGEERVHGGEGGRERPIAGRNRKLRLHAVVEELDARFRQPLPADDVQRVQLVAGRDILHRAVVQDGDEVLVQDRLLLVGQQLEQLVRLVEGFLRQLVAEFAITSVERVAAGVL